MVIDITDEEKNTKKTNIEINLESNKKEEIDLNIILKSLMDLEMIPEDALIFYFEACKEMFVFMEKKNEPFMISQSISGRSKYVKHHLFIPFFSLFLN